MYQVYKHGIKVTVEVAIAPTLRKLFAHIHDMRLCFHAV